MQNEGAARIQRPVSKGVDVVQISGRREFLQCLSRVVPDCVRELTGEPLRLLQAALADREPPVCARRCFRQWEFVGAAEDETHPLLADLRRVIQSWSDRWGLSDDWVLELVLRTLWHWNIDEEACKELRWTPTVGVGYYHPLLHSDLLFKFTHNRWNPRNEEWSVYNKRLEQAFRKYKDMYRTMLKFEICEGRGKPAARKLNDQHFEWLVRYQVQRWPPTAIAQKYCHDAAKETTVRDALRSTAELIGLTVTKRKPGRPRFKKPRI
jgi:hypothetical protein